jgi:hypothetical protein
MALPDPLKKAILQMPAKDKDKLLLRLIGKDSNLVDKLHYELLEGSDTLQERRDNIKKRIVKVAGISQHSPGWIMMDMRSLSGDITQHVKITKDKYGEIELNIQMLNSFFENHKDLLTRYTSRSEKCALYIAKKTQSILKLLARLDDDYHVDFESEMNGLLHCVHTMCSKPYAQEMNLPKQWP